jgi:hypothetical protein
MRTTLIACVVVVLCSLLAAAICPSLANYEVQGAKVRARTFNQIHSAVPNPSDVRLETRRRAEAIYRLHEEHIKSGITLRQLATVLDRPTWFNKRDVIKMIILIGYIPIEWMPSDTLFCVLVFPDPATGQPTSESFRIWISVSGQMDKQDFLSIILDNEKSIYENRKVNAVAVSPPWDEYSRKFAGK